MGELASSVEAKINGAVERNKGTERRAKAISSRVGTLGRDVRRMVLAADFNGAAPGVARAWLVVAGVCAGPASPPAARTSKPASSSLALAVSESSSDSFGTITRHLSASAMARAL